MAKGEDKEVEEGLSYLIRETGLNWWFRRDKNRRYSLLCEVDWQPLNPGGPMVFVGNLTGPQLPGVVNAIRYALAAQVDLRDLGDEE